MLYLYVTKANNMNTLTNLIKIELTTLATNNKKSFNGTFYGDGSIFINGEKYFTADYGTTPNEFRSALDAAKTDFYEKEMDFEGDANPTESMINYINSKY